MGKGSQKEGKNDAKILPGAIFEASRIRSNFGGVGPEAESNWLPPPLNFFEIWSQQAGSGGSSLTRRDNTAKAEVGGYQLDRCHQKHGFMAVASFGRWGTPGRFSA